MGGAEHDTDFAIPDSRDPDALIAYIGTLCTMIASLRDQIARLQEQNAVLRKMCFGPRSERSPKSQELDERQAVLPFPGFLETLAKAREAEASAGEGKQKVREHERTKPKRRKEPPEGLPRHRIEYRVPEEERHCCGEAMRTFGWDRPWYLERFELTVVVVEEREKCVCDRCGRIAVAAAPPRIIDKSILGPNFLARLIFDRFANHMPYSRLEKTYRCEGTELSRSVLCNSVLRCAELLEPVYEALRQDVLGADVVQSDDTEVLQRNGNGKGCQRVHAWVWRANERGTFFEVTEHRSRDGPRRVLGDFEGILQTDGHDCYRKLGDRILTAGCWAHLRRKFDEARRFGDELAAVPFDLIQEIFEIERNEVKSCSSAEERQQVRAERSLPVAEKLFAWMEAQRLSPSRAPQSLLMKAVTYGLNQWERLRRCLEDGRITDITNNAAERALRGLVVGRKNWLFFGSEEGARLGAVLMSLVQSCKELGINPLLYLASVLRLISTTPASEVHSLTPMGWRNRKDREQLEAETLRVLHSLATLAG